MTEDEIRSYFSQYGVVEGVELPYDHTRNRRREFCFVIFENEESADKACYEPKQNLGGREVDIKVELLVFLFYFFKKPLLVIFKN